MKKRDNEESKRLIKERDTLLKQISELKESNINEVSSYKSQISKWRLDCEELNSKLISSNHHISELETEIISLKSKLENVEIGKDNDVTTTTGSKSNNNNNIVLDEEMKLLPLSNEVKKLQSNLTLSEKHMNEYKLLLENSEKQLQNLINSSEAYKVDMESKVKKLEEEKEGINNQLNEQINNNKLGISEIDKLKEEISSLQQDINNNKIKYDENNKRMEEMTKENSEKVEEAKKSKDDYTRELKLHSEAVYLYNYIID